MDQYEYIRTAQRVYGKNISELVPQKLQSQELERIQKITNGDIFEPYLTQRIAKNGQIVNVLIMASALLNEKGKVYAVSTTERVAETRGNS